MPTCSCCAIHVARRYEDAANVASMWRLQADELLREAEDRASFLRAQADQHEADAERERQLDDFPLCDVHEQMTSTVTAGDLLNTRGFPSSVRRRIKDRALAEISRGRRRA
jgi:hypothetical protein